jgi:putative transposase
MPRPLRAAAGGFIYHAVNRANGRMRIFHKDEDYQAFEHLLADAVERTGTRLLAYCLMPNHWHMLVWPHEDGELSRFLGWLTQTHTQRYHAHRHTAGTGHLYQGRFKSFPVEDDPHYYTVARYVERNALRAGLVERAEDWRWGSLYRWLRGTAEEQALLAPWPCVRRPNWVAHVNAALTEKELAAVRHCVQRGCPYGSVEWQEKTSKKLGLESTLRPRGRPRQEKGA